MRIFFDTEFTGLSTAAKLISIGLVDESGLSQFPPNSVTPFTPTNAARSVESKSCDICREGRLRFSGRVAREARGMATGAGPKRSLGVRLSPRRRAVDHLAATRASPQHIRGILGWRGNLKRPVFNFGRRIHHQRGYRVHHVLDDAKVNPLALTW